MNKRLNLAAVFSILLISLVAAPLYGSESISKGWDRSYQTSEFLGKVVMNPQRQYLGRVSDFVFDPNGRVIFAVIQYGKYWRFIGETAVAVPFDALTYDETGKRLTVDISLENFQAAPRFSKSDLTDHQSAEAVYRYFGQQPYWTD